ncbi:voltage-gated potassium channel [Isoptericola jiangsuensis]|uniref:Voltage-gated potassium channel n=1 Tax=Isoptericola jiangsuensis TaxID=548579 RepID=A0A2A9ESP2_9MICO|nr:potassium channel family protein [Isoptericola jiangsuensis]PFG42157.1 voltage-gated potassium channel [Isoptericola jiangsuensis]
MSSTPAPPTDRPLDHPDGPATDAPDARPRTGRLDRARAAAGGDGAGDRFARWERAVEWPLLVVALLFLVAYAVPVAFPDVPAAVRTACSGVLWLTWVAFVVDYGVRLVLTPRRWHFVRTHPLDLAVIALPLLRPLRLLLLVNALLRINRMGSRHLRGQVVVFAAAGTALLVLTGALAITNAERGVPGSSIANLGDGFWWAIVTMSTVGYGDMFPVTVTGRFVAVGLMIGGIALLGVVTATLASWLVERVDATTEEEHQATRGQVDALHAELAALRAELRDRAVLAPSGPSGTDDATGAPPHGDREADGRR